MKHIIEIDIAALTQRERDNLYYLLYDSENESTINSEAICNIAQFKEC